MVSFALLLMSLGWRLTVPGGRDVSDLLAAAAAALVSVPVFVAALRSLRNPGLHGMSDQLVAVALLAAWATGELLTAALLPIVMIVGHVLEERSLLGSGEAIRALGRLVDTDVRRRRPDGGFEQVPSSALAPGDVVALVAGDRVPADGTVTDGHGSVDLSSLTGESVPVDVGPGDPVMAGGIALDAVLTVRVERTGVDTTLGRIIGLMADAEHARPPITRLLERHAGSYMALILLLAAGVWFASGSTDAMLAVLVASCPCALVLAAPAAAIAAIAVASRHGILIKGSAFLEQLAECSSLVLDKTGTLTGGELAHHRTIAVAGADPSRAERLAASLGRLSAHPVSRALSRDLAHHLPCPLAEAREERGLGLVATDDETGHVVALGRPALLERLGISCGAPPPFRAGPLVAVGEDGRLLGWLALTDPPRPEAAAALADLRADGLDRQLLLTGDRAEVASAVAASLGVPDVEAGVLPEGKMARVVHEIEQGWKPLVVGDGINDALALRAGAVGIAIGARGTDVALASADVVLMTADLRRLGTCVRLSRRCRQTIHVNIAAGLAWTAALIALASFGLLGAEGAIVAAVLHNVSTLFGVANAGRLLRFDETGEAETA